ncbi:hypothetical protein LTR53_008260 [Teratosphaeriaceae sp. CCFEE 6253]|nr:hypothetical protein LTR53_008260 [Teratosphaeriaceae sp. CCFEE 6253]
MRTVVSVVDCSEDEEDVDDMLVYDVVTVDCELVAAGAELVEDDGAEVLESDVELAVLEDGAGVLEMGVELVEDDGAEVLGSDVELVGLDEDDAGLLETDAELVVLGDDSAGLLGADAEVLEDDGAELLGAEVEPVELTGALSVTVTEAVAVSVCVGPGAVEMTVLMTVFSSVVVTCWVLTIVDPFRRQPPRAPRTTARLRAYRATWL